MSEEELQGKDVGCDGVAEASQPGIEVDGGVGASEAGVDIGPYRMRAKMAEDRVRELHDQLHALQGRLEEADRTIGQLERRSQIDSLLAESKAIDLDAARVLVEHSVSQADEPDVSAVVSELKAKKPYLFRRSVQASGSTMSAKLDDEITEPLSMAAGRAMRSGDRYDLLQYLRMKREGKGQ